MAIATEDMELTDAANDNTVDNGDSGEDNIVSDVTGDVNTEANGEDDEVKAKREKIDLTAIDPNTSVTLVITVPAGMKLAAIKAGESEDSTGTSWARTVLANALGYEVPASFTERTRTKKYATDAERIAAQAARAKGQRELMKELLKISKSGVTLTPEAMRELSVKHGVA